jgi:hypothetical protein
MLKTQNRELDNNAEKRKTTTLVLSATTAILATAITYMLLKQRS